MLLVFGAILISNIIVYLCLIMTLWVMLALVRLIVTVILS